MEKAQPGQGEGVPEAALGACGGTGARRRMATAAERKNERIISALLTCPTVRAAAEACGVSERRIYARLKDPAFCEQYEAKRHELLDHATAKLQGRIGEAVETMGEVMNDPKSPPQTRLNAADAIIRNGLKLTEQSDIIARLDALERASK